MKTKDLAMPILAIIVLGDTMQEILLKNPLTRSRLRDNN